MTSIDLMFDVVLDEYRQLGESLQKYQQKLTGAPPYRPSRPPQVNQNDPLWRDEHYSETTTCTFGQCGCYVCALYSLACWGGYIEDLSTFAESLDEVGVFDRGDLMRRDLVSKAVPVLRWDGVYVRSELRQPYVSWRYEPADLELLQVALRRNPVVVEIDFLPGTVCVEQHFVLAYAYIAPSLPGSIEDDLLVMDPWGGDYTSILTYFNPAWLRDGTMPGGVTKVARTVTGARLWRVEG